MTQHSLLTRLQSDLLSIGLYFLLDLRTRSIQLKHAKANPKLAEALKAQRNLPVSHLQANLARRRELLSPASESTTRLA